MSTAKARAPKPRKVTGVTIRRVREQFRAFVIALPPGATLEWFDMDLWVFVNFPEYNRDDGDYEDDRDPNVECMVVAQEMESQGWLAYRPPCTRGNGDDYYRTDQSHVPYVFKPRR